MRQTSCAKSGHLERALHSVTSYTRATLSSTALGLGFLGHETENLSNPLAGFDTHCVQTLCSLYNGNKEGLIMTCRFSKSVARQSLIHAHHPRLAYPSISVAHANEDRLVHGPKYLSDPLTPLHLRPSCRPMEVILLPSLTGPTTRMHSGSCSPSAPSWAPSRCSKMQI